jgi:PAS domain S-box-containing protein
MKKVLIVDDNDANLYLLKSLMEEEGFAVIAAKNGREALEQAHAELPDLIVSDILMPVMDGYLLCRECKSDEQLRQIPFVFYTATYTEPKDEKFALSLGADRFVLKPQEPEIFLNILREVWKERSPAGPGAPEPLGEEMAFFRQYNAVLFRKLEKKMLDLETTNRKLKYLEEQYRLSFENVTDIVLTIDAGFNVQQMSPSVERMLGYKSQDFIGRSVSDFLKIIAPESMERAMAEIRLVLSGQTIPDSVYSLVARDGTVNHGEFSGSPIRREGEIVGMVSVIREITKRKRAEDELRRMNTFLDSVVENIPNMIFLKDAGELRFVRFNRAGEDLLGHSRNDLLGKNDYDFFPKEQADHFTEKDREVLRGQKVVDIPEEPIQTLNMGERTLHTKKVPLLGANGKPEYLLGISEDITERKRMETERQQHYDRLRKALEATVHAIAVTVETRDPYTAGHQRRVADLSRTIGSEMGLSHDQIDGLHMASKVHDIGKISVPADILSKPSKLTPTEFSLIKTHARSGYDILKDIEFPWPVARMVLEHHERMDGSGYPRNLKGEEILMEARILAVADVVEAMASHRPYRPGLGLDAALAEIEKNMGAIYDITAADACLRLFREKGFKLEGS